MFHVVLVYSVGLARPELNPMFHAVLVCSVGLAQLELNPLLCNVSVLSWFSSTRAKPCVSCSLSVSVYLARPELNLTVTSTVIFFVSLFYMLNKVYLGST